MKLAMRISLLKVVYVHVLTADNELGRSQ